MFGNFFFCINIDGMKIYRNPAVLNLLSYIHNFLTSPFGLVVKPKKNSIFLKKSKMVISVENRKFSRSRMTKWTAPLNSSRKI